MVLLPPPPSPGELVAPNVASESLTDPSEQTGTGRFLFGLLVVFYTTGTRYTGASAGRPRVSEKWRGRSDGSTLGNVWGVEEEEEEEEEEEACLANCGPVCLESVGQEQFAASLGRV
ncbi:hypothetical protein CDEST_06094 [Colletotrichum destructivum]|uniref:Uncharacterized protein n=1 Tax=Colletotrichum destructivum TaxID=34406 RepID=A0AAX4ICW8_9PEZI|nr:hypothetical protein CDEST_06094 [Colletotrichum destructivum]